MTRGRSNRGWNQGLLSLVKPRAEQDMDTRPSVPQLSSDTPPTAPGMQPLKGALARLAATQLGLLPPPFHPHFLAGPGMSNSRLHKFQAQSQQGRKQRTFSQSWDGGKGPVWNQSCQLLQGVRELSCGGGTSCRHSTHDLPANCLLCVRARLIANSSISQSLL